MICVFLTIYYLIFYLFLKKNAKNINMYVYFIAQINIARYQVTISIIRVICKKKSNYLQILFIFYVHVILQK